jgi:prohibitin 1
MRNKKFSNYYRNISIFILIVLFLFIALSSRIIVKIPAGHVGVLYHLTKGTITDEVYAEGYKMILPIHTMYIYDVRKQIVEQQMDVLTKDGLKIRLEIDTRFRLVRDSIGIVHKNIGQSYINTILKPEIESSTRKIISNYDPEELYTINRAEIENEIAKDSEQEFGEEDIIVDDIMIKNIQLPDLVAQAIELKLAQEQKNLEYSYILQREEKEAQRKLIEAEGIKKFNDASGISIVTWRGIDATIELSKSNNSKVIVIGNDSKSLPIILGANKN